MAVIAVKQRQKILLGKAFRCCKCLRDSTSQPLIHPFRRFFPNIRTDHRDPVQPIAKPNDLQKKLHRLLEASGFFKNLKGRGNHAALEIPGLDLPLPFFSIPRFQFLALAEKILSPGERVQFDAAPDKRRALLTFWVLKEARVKRTGEGLRGYPNKTDFSLDDPRVTEMDGCLVAVIE